MSESCTLLPCMFSVTVTDSELFKWQELWHTYRTLQPGEILYQTQKVNKLLNVDAT